MNSLEWLRAWQEAKQYTADDPRYCPQPYDPSEYKAPNVFPPEVIGPHGNAKYVHTVTI